MYNIFYIYTYKYTRPSNTLTRPRPKRPYKPRPHKQPDKLYSLTSAGASHLYMGKMQKPHNATKLYNLAICTYVGDFEKIA